MKTICAPTLLRHVEAFVQSNSNCPAMSYLESEMIRKLIYETSLNLLT